MKNRISKDDIFRSIFFVPAHVDKFFNKAIESDADALAFDLEDGVPVEAKEGARISLKQKLSQKELPYPVLIRVNAMGTDLFEEDVREMFLPSVKAFILPKAKTAQDIIYFDDLLSNLEKQNKITSKSYSIFPLIETTEAVLNAFEIAKSSERIAGLIFGHEDFLLDLRAGQIADLSNLLVPRMMVSMAARAAGCQPIDTPYLQIPDLDGCAEHVRDSRGLGFSGMLVLHPSQLIVANEGYLPSKNEMFLAEKTISLNEEANKKNRSIAFSNGEFVAPPVLKRAKNVLEVINMFGRWGKDGKD